MGNLLARHQNRGSEELDSAATWNAYFYPPKIGNYFSSHFIMGGERFESCQPEAYLFGENMDLNFLGGKPTPFPYSAPMPNEPTRTLRALINIRKESLRFVKVPVEVCTKLKNYEENTHSYDDSENYAEQMPVELQKDKLKYNIEFIFDTDVKCAITIYYMCSEEITPSGIVYTPRDTSKNSETFTFKRGANQHFIQASHVFDPSMFDEDDLMYRAFDEHGNFDQLVPFPVVIQCLAEEGGEPRQSHTLIAVVERNSDGSVSIKPFKQKVFIDGLCYLFQEIYGIENKSVAVKRISDNGHLSPDDDCDENGSECVICMSDSRDTLILPCRHLCLCYACADSLRYQANNCPICRSPFRALLQIKAVRKRTSSIGASPPTFPPVLPHHQLCSAGNELVDIPPGYEAISLLEALNGTSVTLSSSHGMYSFKSASDEECLKTPVTSPHYKRMKKPKTLEGNARGAKEYQREDSWTMVQMRPNRLSQSNIGAESSGSSNSSSTQTKTVPPERRRLLSREGEEDNDETVELAYKTPFGANPKQIFRARKDPAAQLLADVTPSSAEVSSESLPILSLADGIDEQQYMMETDLMSVTTRGSSPNILTKCESSHDYSPSDCHSTASKTATARHLPGIARLAEHETTDDLDLSPVNE